MINNIKIFLKNNRRDLFYILLLIIILLIISIPKLLIQFNIGIANWDTYLYLENGRKFAKMGWGDVPSISPVLPALLSKLFLLSGHVYPEAIFIVDVFFYILGVVSLYLLFRYKFNYNTSLLGSLIYATFTLVYSWVAIGGNDIIGVSGTILTVYLILLANKYSYKYYLIALPVAAYSFLSRYTAGVMLFAIIFFIIINKINKKELKYLISGSFLGVISISWFLYEFNKVLHTPFPFLEQFAGTVKNTPVLDSGYVPDNLYFIKNILQYLSSYVNINDFDVIINPSFNTPSILSVVLLILMFIGIISIAYKIYSSIKKSEYEFLTGKNIVLLISILILFGLFIISIGESYIKTISIFVLFLIGLYYLLIKYNIEKLDYELLMILLFIVYLIFQSILTTKNDRYFITVMPFIAYFITCGIDWIYNIVKERFNLNSQKTQVITCVIIAFLVVNSLMFTFNMPDDNHYTDIEESCDWIVNYDNNITNQTIIYSDNWPAISWYMNIYGLRGVVDIENTSQIWLFSQQLLSQNETNHAATYYIDTNNEYKLDYPGLTKIHENGDVVIYENTYLLNNKNSTVESDEYINYINKTLEDTKKYYGDVDEFI